MIKIALAKGRLAQHLLDKLAAVGITFPDYSEKSRKLIFQDATGCYSIVFVKPSDVGIYVEKGACDLGVAGRDTLLESQPDVYEMLDLGCGKCRFAVAGPEGFQQKPGQKLRVATKYPNVAKSYFAKNGQPIEIIQINGSVELAPLMGLADVIVDIVETGATLKENGLAVLTEITEISARLIVNKVSLKTKQEEVTNLLAKLR